MPLPDATARPIEVWFEAGSDPVRYRQLMDERGLRPLRVLVTASRTWVNAWPIRHDLASLLRERGRLVVVHGACPEGGDLIAHRWACDAKATGAHVDVEPWPADWTRYGRAAGPMRNAGMVKAGADVCLAYIGPCTKAACHEPKPHGSHGASGCADLARQAGIDTHITPWAMT